MIAANNGKVTLHYVCRYFIVLNTNPCIALHYKLIYSWGDLYYLVLR